MKLVVIPVSRIEVDVQGELVAPLVPFAKRGSAVMLGIKKNKHVYVEVPVSIKFDVIDLLREVAPPGEYTALLVDIFIPEPGSQPVYYVTFGAAEKREPAFEGFLSPVLYDAIQRLVALGYAGWVALVSLERAREGLNILRRNFGIEGLSVLDPAGALRQVPLFA